MGSNSYPWTIPHNHCHGSPHLFPYVPIPTSASTNQNMVYTVYPIKFLRGLYVYVPQNMYIACIVISKLSWGGGY